MPQRGRTGREQHRGMRDPLMASLGPIPLYHRRIRARSYSVAWFSVGKILFFVRGRRVVVRQSKRGPVNAVG
jgi:hypothetical protein